MEANRQLLLENLLEQWHTEVGFHSSPPIIMRHPNVDRIMTDFGEEVLLKKLTVKPFWGLVLLLLWYAGPNLVVPPQHRGDIQELTKILVQWGSR